ncbi:YslB family protein [Shouchella miscanthi]|uniref:YslB family protein n=1 Tax=Shouchella miscanthi TaxID=2598861 RepID=A0ABU6NMJ4_9BACI|nr:YslB family protein [Shouchella miscanthi]MED4129232.1 YslB family protein [Shouchella miscanthi]
MNQWGAVMSETNQQLKGYELIRNDVLQLVLGKEHDHLLYWVGKSLARKYKLEQIEELHTFFKQVYWGDLSLVKQKKNEWYYELSGEWMTKEDERSYQLEAGFLAETLETQFAVATAATYTKKGKAIRLTVHFDHKDTVAI